MQHFTATAQNLNRKLKLHLMNSSIQKIISMTKFYDKVPSSLSTAPKEDQVPYLSCNLLSFASLCDPTALLSKFPHFHVIS